MPLVRLEMRSEYGLGDPELYRKASKKEDPKEILDGVSVAGLVGILRQLGDLAEFAADVFHDLHEQITVTAARSRKMMARVRNIESALPSVEKAFKEQKSHIHFAYVAGSGWNARIQDDQNLLLSSELPRFMMDSYEECHDPPRLFLLDKFDHGGSGACLKRYSDPSYFKRVWAASQMERAENVHKDRKVQKLKRKGSRCRNGEVQNAVYIPRHDRRNSDTGARFASPSIDGHSISAENISTSDLRLNPEILSRSTSFSSKTKESYVEQTSFVNPPLVPDELDYVEMHNPNLYSKGSELSVSALHDEPTADDLDDVSQHDSLNEHSVPRSSSVTWDEKTEIIKPLSPASYDDILVDRVQVSEGSIRVQDPEHMHEKSEPENFEHAKAGAVIQEDILFHATKIPGSLSHFDEITSETDNYVDAPTTLDSETETETECHTKREVQSPSDLSMKEMESATVINQVISVQNPDSLDVEAPKLPQTSLNQDMTRNFSDFIYSSALGHDESPCSTEFVQNQECIVANNACENIAPKISEIKDQCKCIDSGLSRETGASTSPTMRIETPAESAILKHSVPTDLSGVPSIQLWTNGGLLGVEPSKPPDFGVGNKKTENGPSDFSSYTVKPQMVVNELSTKSDAAFMLNNSTSVNSGSKAEVGGDYSNLDLSAQDNSIDDQLLAGESNAVQKSKNSSSCQDNHHDSDVKRDTHASVQPFSQSEFEKFSNGSYCSNDVNSNKLDISRSNSTGTLLRVSYSTGSRQEVPSQSTIGISSSFSELAQRFLANTIQRKAPSTPFANTETRKPEGPSCLSDSKEESNAVTSQESYEQSTNEKVACVSEKEPTAFSASHYPEQSSPPLEYMKISFHPMNGLENSKLKLEFSSGNLHENNEDFIFPSFQLLQYPVDTLPEVCSESDDDTFCRSCPYSSEDLQSPHSYSQSEQWEQEERSEYIDHGMNDVLHMLQSTTSISGSMGFGEMNHSNLNVAGGLENFDVVVDTSKVASGSLTELPGLDSVLSLENQEEEMLHSLPENPANSEAQSKVETPPPLPPLPPMQWRSIKSTVSLEDNDATVASNLDHFNGLEALRCSPFQKKEQNSLRPPSVVGAVSQNFNDKEDPQKSNGQKQLTHSINHQEVDTREDLLLQIRNKSFNLRRTATSAPRDIPQPTANNAAPNGNVAAILQKASAIRQAFASSDDDNWSDA